MRPFITRRTRLDRLAGAPAAVLDIIDTPVSADRYTVILGGPWATESGGKAWVSYLALSDNPDHPQGFSQWGELEARAASDYRRRNWRNRIKWADLPANVRHHVAARLQED